MAFASSITSRMRNFLFGLVILTLATKTLATDIAYCSTQNTGLYFAGVYNQYQSNGACHDTCKGQYVISVISGAYCWCTNYAPATTVSTNNCDIACPGFGSEWCGDPSGGYFAYFLIDGATPVGTTGIASSTIAASSSSPLSSSSSSLVSTTLSRTGLSMSSSGISYGGVSSSHTVIATTQSPTTSRSAVVSVTTSPETSVEPVASSSIAPSSVSSSSPVPIPSSSSSSSISTTTSIAAPVSSSISTRPISSSLPATTTQPLTEVYTSVTTVTGQVRTVVVTPTPPPDSTLGSNTSAGGGGGVSPGKVVGIVVGVALGIGLLIGLGVWYWLRRRHQRNIAAVSAGADVASNTGNGVPSRQVSQMSSAGLLSKGPRINTTGLPPSTGPRSAQSSQLNRQSLGTDQRLNPYAIYAQEESRLSNVSLQDNHDYSRQLRVANPDP